MRRARRAVRCVRRARARAERTTRRRGWSEGGVARAERQTRREEEEEEKTNTARERPCSTAAARATRGVRARRARRARVVCRSVRRSLASLEAATTEKTRDKDDDRRQRTGEDHHSGANTPARLRRREPPVVYARAARVARASSVAPCAAPSLRSKRRPQKRCETRTTTGDREQEKITTVARTPLHDCGGESHQRCTRAPRARPTARPTRRCWASERESGARGATDGTNETTPNPQRRAAHERGGGLSDGAWRSDSQRTGRPTARVAFGVRLPAHPLVGRALPAGAGTRSERAARAGRRTGQRNDARGGGVKGIGAEECCFRALRSPAQGRF